MKTSECQKRASAAWYERQKAKGLLKKTIWVTPEQWEEIQRYLDAQEAEPLKMTQEEYEKYIKELEKNILKQRTGYVELAKPQENK